MTRKEIEKAIEKGEDVWCIFLNEGYEIKIKNHTNRFINTNGNEEMYNYTDENGTDRCFPIKALYKTKAEAEHYLRHANITRTETLPFLTWEEFKDGKDITFKAKNGHEFLLKTKQESIYLWWLETNNIWATWDLTEENFYKAYDECARLFKGGEDE